MKMKFFLIFILAFLSAMACYKGHGLDPYDAEADISAIEGTVTFVGQWPDSTKEVRVAVMKEYPRGIQDEDSLLAFVISAYALGDLVFSDTIPKFIDSWNYHIEVKPDIYEWVLVAWFPDIPLYLTGVKELGAYYADSEASAPSPVQVIPGAATKSIDISADFKNVFNHRPFLKFLEIK